MWPEGEEERGGGEEGRRGWITEGLQLFQQLDFHSEQGPVPREGLEHSVRIRLMSAEAQLGCVRRVGVRAQRAMPWVVAKFCTMGAGGGRGFDQSRESGWGGEGQGCSDSARRG